jgi:hypothetical protein
MRTSPAFFPAFDAFIRARAPSSWSSRPSPDFNFSRRNRLNRAESPRMASRASGAGRFGMGAIMPPPCRLSLRSIDRARGRPAAATCRTPTRRSSSSEGYTRYREPSEAGLTIDA